jgi:hypothetical protein
LFEIGKHILINQEAQYWSKFVYYVARFRLTAK